MNDHKRHKRLLACLVISWLAVWPAAQATAADTSIRLQADVGWHGLYKSEAWTTLHVHIDNPGAGFQGRIVVEQEPEHSPVLQGSYEQAVSLPSGGSAQVDLDMPSALFKNVMYVRLLDGNGNERQTYKVTSDGGVQNSLLIGGLAEQSDDLNLFSLQSRADQGKITLAPLDGTDIPSRATSFGGLDMLVINHAPKTALSQKQVGAIHQWVQEGGRLLLAGGASYGGYGSAFADISPVAVSGTRDITDLTSLGVYAGQPPNTDHLTVSVGSLQKEARSLLSAVDVPLLAERKVGAGAVYYAAYDLGAEPLASWQGNKTLWGRVFRQAGMELKPRWDGEQANPMFTENKGPLFQVSQMFAHLAPSTNVSAVIFFGYLVLIGPVLYIVLRRKNKREWTWMLIPAASLLVTLGVYLFGSAQRVGGAVGQFVSDIELASDKVATVEAAGSFVVTKGGDYTVDLRPGTRTLASAQSVGEKEPRIVTSGDKQQIHYQSVDYWTTRTAYIEGALHDQGDVQSDLLVDPKGRLTGTLTNRTAFDLGHAFLVIGNQSIALPDLKKGATAKVDELLQPAEVGDVNLSDANSTINHMFPVDTADRNELDNYRYLASFRLNRWEPHPAPIQLFAFTNTPLDFYSIEGVRLDENRHLSLVHQNLTFAADREGMTLPMGFLAPQLVTHEGMVAPQGHDYLMSGGKASITFRFDVLPDPGAAISRVTTNLDQGLYAMYDKSLYNWQTGRWEAASKANTPHLTGDLMKRYISPDGELRIKISTESAQGQVVSPPNISVEGKGGAR